MVIYVRIGRAIGEATGGILRCNRFITHAEIQTGKPSQSAQPPSVDANSYNRRDVRTVLPSVMCAWFKRLVRLLSVGCFPICC
jgi:hypothetical protein